MHFRRVSPLVIFAEKYDQKSPLVKENFLCYYGFVHICTEVREMDEQQHVNFEMDQEDPFNPKKDRSVWIKRLAWGAFVVALIVYYILVTR